MNTENKTKMVVSNKRSFYEMIAEIVRAIHNSGFVARVCFRYDALVASDQVWNVEIGWETKVEIDDEFYDLADTLASCCHE